MSTYRAVQVTAPGKMELVQRPLIDPPAGRVRLRVEACGICHSDSVTVDGLIPGIAYPRVPGHEVVGRIDALGEGVSGWKIGQRVGVGFLGGHCGVCTPCRRGDFVNCTNQPISGVHHDGGYAESMIAIPSGLASIPDDLGSADAAPLLCAGVTTGPGDRRRGGPIHVICDNAGFHTSHAVIEYLWKHEGRIEVHLLPSYSPDYNPSERVWWHLHEEITRNHRCKDSKEL